MHEPTAPSSCLSILDCADHRKQATSLMLLVTQLGCVKSNNTVAFMTYSSFPALQKTPVDISADDTMPEIVDL